jgi:BMFP domain-containing protein YqiC
MTHDEFRLANGFDQESDFELSPASQRALDGNGHSRAPVIEQDLRAELIELQHKVAKLEKKRSPKAMSYAEAESLAEAIGNVIAKTEKKLDQLVKRVAELEARPELKYRGPWQDKMSYSAGTFVSFGGSLWHSNENGNTSKPGCDDKWQLAVKHGRAATAIRPAPNAGR